MRVTFVGTTSGGGQCPTVHITDRGTAIVQGTRITDPDALQDLAAGYGGLPDHEIAVEVPIELLQRFTNPAAEMIAAAQAATA